MNRKERSGICWGGIKHTHREQKRKYPAPNRSSYQMYALNSIEAMFFLCQCYVTEGRLSHASTFLISRFFFKWKWREWEKKNHNQIFSLVDLVCVCIFCTVKTNYLFVVCFFFCLSKARHRLSITTMACYYIYFSMLYFWWRLNISCHSSLYFQLTPYAYLYITLNL